MFEKERGVLVYVATMSRAVCKLGCGDPFFFPIFEVARRKGLVSDGKEVMTGAAVRMWKGYEMRS